MSGRATARAGDLGKFGGHRARRAGLLAAPTLALGWAWALGARPAEPGDLPPLVKLSAPLNLDREVKDKGFRFASPRDGLEVDFVYVRPGTFELGRSHDEIQKASRADGAYHHSFSYPRLMVAVADGYYIARTETTVHQYYQFLNDPERLKQVRAGTAKAVKTPPGLAALMRGTTGLGEAGRLPITQISWDDAVEYCNWLAQQMKCDKTCTVRLPTEIEWEYAARGGDSRPTPWVGAGSPPGGPSGRPHPVGDVEADRSWCGAADLAGNVSEWCLDAFDERSNEKLATAAAGGAYAYRPPRALAAGGSRPIRGGSYDDAAANCEAATRRYKAQSSTAEFLGFRPVLVTATGPLSPLPTPAVVATRSTALPRVDPSRSLYSRRDPKTGTLEYWQVDDHDRSFWVEPPSASGPSLVSRSGRSGTSSRGSSGASSRGSSAPSRGDAGPVGTLRMPPTADSSKPIYKKFIAEFGEFRYFQLDDRGRPFWVTIQIIPVD